MSGKLAALLCLGFILLGVSPGLTAQRPLKAVVGIATVYSQKLHGRETTSGEIFDREAFTAAHRTYPFGTLLRVENLKNGRKVMVRVNDRGPFVRGRMIDLSPAAARALGFRTGLAKVRIEKIDPPPPAISRARAAASVTSAKPPELPPTYRFFFLKTDPSAFSYVALFSHDQAASPFLAPGHLRPGSKG